jgi:hypothetical protein
MIEKISVAQVMEMNELKPQIGITTQMTDKKNVFVAPPIDLDALFAASHVLSWCSPECTKVTGVIDHTGSVSFKPLRKYLLLVRILSAISISCGILVNSTLNLNLFQQNYSNSLEFLNA